MKTLPEVSESRPATQCISVDLPEPDGPMMAAKRARVEVDRHAVERSNLGVAAAVDLDGVDGRGPRRSRRRVDSVATGLVMKSPN